MQAPARTHNFIVIWSGSPEHPSEAHALCGAERFVEWRHSIRIQNAPLAVHDAQTAALGAPLRASRVHTLRQRLRHTGRQVHFVRALRTALTTWIAENYDNYDI